MKNPTIPRVGSLLRGRRDLRSRRKNVFAIIATLGLSACNQSTPESPAIAGFEQVSSYANGAGGNTYVFQEKGGDRSAIIMILPSGGAPGGIITPGGQAGTDSIWGSE